MSERVPEPWYGFIDGPRMQNGARLPFKSTKAAAVWMFITFCVAGVLFAAIVVGGLILRHHVVAIGFFAPLVVVGGPVAVGSLMAFIHTTGDLIAIHRKPTSPQQ
jgi:hypothetical protein